MPEEQAKSPSEKPRRRRKRSSQKKRAGRAPGAESGPTASGKSSARQDDARSERRNRRRRRRRSRSQQPATVQEREPSPPQKDTLKAELPESIFVYTHVIRSSELDTYGFRSDPFLKGSRELADFRIDLSPLFPEGEIEDGPIFDSALHGAVLFSSEDDDDADEDDSDDEI